MSRLKQILRRKEEREAKLKSALASIVDQLKALGALKIILFGSLARGDVDVYSDLDLLAIMPPTRSGKEWMKFIYENVERGIASDIVVYNQREFEEESPTSSFLRDVLSSGRVVYEKAL
ncbi:MAG: nucleotidyltransferase domain-containing protein [bacterium]